MNKLHLIVAMVLFVLTVGCSNNSAEKKLPGNVVKNTKSASSQKPYEAPKMTFEETEHDFGRIIQGEKIAFNYYFENTGKSDLVITKVTTSCGCTVGNYPKEPVKPGGKGKIEVVFDSKGKKGFQNKRATVLANTQPNHTALTIKGLEQCVVETVKYTSQREAFGKPLLDNQYINMNLAEMQMEIEALPEKEFARLRRWFAEKDWEQWDRQIEADTAAGKLDFLLAEASEAKIQKTLREL